MLAETIREVVREELVAILQGLNTPTETRVYFNTQQAAEYVNEAKSTLEKKRMKGTGPKFIKSGRSVRYHKDDLDAYAASNRRSHTSQAA